MVITLAQIRERLSNRRFTVAGNTHRLSSADTVFHYHVEENSIWGTYQGGRIRMGHQVGRVTGPIPLSFFIIA